MGKNNYCLQKCREELETSVHVTGVCRATAEGDYTHFHSEVVSIVHQ